MAAQGKFDGSSQLHVVKTGTWLYKRKEKKWRNKPMKRRKKKRREKINPMTKHMTIQH